MARQTTYLALLRAVNVGGRTVPMAALRECFATLGYDDARTYLQSGNVVFRTRTTRPSELASAIEPVLSERFGIAVPTAVLSAGELAAVIAANPFAPQAADPTTVIVSFLGSPVPPAVAAAFDLSDFPESGQVGDRVLYLHYPNGQGRSKLVPAVLERRLGGIWGTARNWRTVLALGDLAT